MDLIETNTTMVVLFGCSIDLNLDASDLHNRGMVDHRCAERRSKEKFRCCCFVDGHGRSSFRSCKINSRDCCAVCSSGYL